MSISGIGQSGQLNRIDGVSWYDRFQSDDRTTSQVSGGGKDDSSISQMGQWMSQLSKLASTDTDAFKDLAQQISEDLAQQAGSASSTGQSSMLSNLSDKFATAASTGSMDSLKPDGPPPAHHGQGGGSMSQVEDIISQSLSTLSNAGIDSSSTASWQGGGMETLMKQLDSLSQTDPAAFKEVTASIAEQLSSLSGASGTGSSGMLSDLSSRFSQASQSGSAEGLEPQGPPPPPPPPSSGSGDSSSQSGSYGVANSNQELFAMLQTMMGGQSSSLSDAVSWTSFMNARNAYGVSG